MARNSRRSCSGGALVTSGERGQPTVSDDVVDSTTVPRRSVGEAEAKRLLAELGLSVPAARLAHSADEAAQAAEEIGFPVVVKVASPDILHKSDVGGVILGVTTAEQARAAFEQVTGSARRARPDARVDAALVEASCPPGGVELIVGVVRDPRFGPVDRKSTRLNSSHSQISYAVFCLKKKKKKKKKKIKKKKIRTKLK